MGRIPFLFIRSATTVILFAPLLVGCIQWHRGYYDASELPTGWQCKQEKGKTIFRYPIPKKPKWYISAYSPEKGTLYFHLGSFGQDQSALYRSLKFSGDTIRIICHDISEVEAIGTNVDFASYYSQTIRAGDSEDFTVILPTFAIGDIDIPALSARFKWSDKEYFEYVPLQ